MTGATTNRGFVAAIVRKGRQAEGGRRRPSSRYTRKLSAAGASRDVRVTSRRVRGRQALGDIQLKRGAPGIKETPASERFDDSTTNIGTINKKKYRGITEKRRRLPNDRTRNPSSGEVTHKNYRALKLKEGEKSQWRGSQRREAGK